jgi:hypothetical protein
MLKFHLLFDLGFDGFEDGGPATAGDGMLIPIGAFPDGVVVALGGGQGSDAAFLAEFAGDSQVVLREIGYLGIIGVDHRVFEVLAGLDLFDGALDGDELNAVEIPFPDQGASYLPVGEGFTAKHILFCLGGVGEGVPDL